MRRHTSFAHFSASPPAQALMSSSSSDGPPVRPSLWAPADAARAPSSASPQLRCLQRARLLRCLQRARLLTAYMYALVSQKDWMKNLCAIPTCVHHDPGRECTSLKCAIVVPHTVLAPGCASAPGTRPHAFFTGLRPPQRWFAGRVSSDSSIDFTSAEVVSPRRALCRQADGIPEVLVSIRCTACASFLTLRVLVSAQATYSPP